MEDEQKRIQGKQRKEEKTWKEIDITTDWESINPFYKTLMEEIPNGGRVVIKRERDRRNGI